MEPVKIPPVYNSFINQNQKTAPLPPAAPTAPSVSEPPLKQDNNKKLKHALIGLAVVGIAGIGLVFAAKKGKAPKIDKVSESAAKEVLDVVPQKTTLDEKLEKFFNKRADILEADKLSLKKQMSELPSDMQESMNDTMMNIVTFFSKEPSFNLNKLLQEGDFTCEDVAKIASDDDAVLKFSDWIFGKINKILKPDMAPAMEGREQEAYNFLLKFLNKA